MTADLEIGRVRPGMALNGRIWELVEYMMKRLQGAGLKKKCLVVAKLKITKFVFKDINLLTKYANSIYWRVVIDIDCNLNDNVHVFSNLFSSPSS